MPLSPDDAPSPCQDRPIRVAVWSGPRNLSTALMRSFSSRSDCVVSDEPFYASYLLATGFDHPGRAEVLASQPTDWREVACALAHGPLPARPAAGGVDGGSAPGRSVWYQKHMAQHMREEMLDDWLWSLEHAILVRHPARVIASYRRVVPRMTLEETGLVWQVRLVERLLAAGRPRPVVIDASEVRADPEATLRRLCAGLGIPFEPAMLAWPAGPHPRDGVWAPHWYAGTWNTTGFDTSPEAPPPDVEAPFLEEALALYDWLRSCSNGPTPPTPTSS
jgi:hypothetical protein